MSAGTDTEPGGNFTSVADSCGFYDFSGPWTSGASQPLQPGTYYVHLELYNTTWAEYRWTPVSSFTIPKTAKPKIIWKAAWSKWVWSGGQWQLKVSCPVVVVDDSWAKVLIRLTQERVVGGKVKASFVRNYWRSSPRTLGSKKHTYTFVFLRAASCRGKGRYIVLMRAQDQECNWSKTAGDVWTVPA